MNRRRKTAAITLIVLSAAASAADMVLIAVLLMWKLTIPRQPGLGEMLDPFILLFWLAVCVTALIFGVISLRRSKLIRQ